MCNRPILFQDALRLSATYGKRHLLLGNGFSIACVPNIFTYKSLLAESEIGSYPEMKQAFQLLETSDFELVVEALEKTSKVLPAYNSDLTELPPKIYADAQKIKELLIETIASRHPAYPAEIEDEKYKNVRIFLSYFIDKEKSNKSRIYSLNYDMLLYWALMHETQGETFELIHNDGFGYESHYDDGERLYSDILTWSPKFGEQNIHYLHGALHLFDSGHQIEKFNWVNTGITLIEQCRQALVEDKFPLFVTEGDKEKKLKKITHNPYLFNSYESFGRVANGGISGRSGNTCMFTYGVSFSPNDDHIFNIIANGSIKHLFIGLYGNPESEENKNVIAKGELMKAIRSVSPLEITYFDSTSAKVWG